MSITILMYTNVTNLVKYKFSKIKSELKTFEWWISGLMLDPLFLIISRLT